MQLIQGKNVAAKIKQDIAARVKDIVAGGGTAPHLVGVIVGHDGGSESYMASMERTCAECGIRSTVLRYEDTITQDELLAEIARLNGDPDVNGYIVQMPLPRHINRQTVVDAIDYRKDMDCLTSVNMGRMALGLPCFTPATPTGIMLLLEHYGIETRGKHCVVLGRSNIVGKPIATMLMQKATPGNCTVTVCHSATPNIADFTRQADILIAALGSPAFVTADMVKPGAVVIDVGTTRVPDSTRERGWRLCGDVDFDAVAPLCSHITPVPGGVGPMTIVSLMHNVLKTLDFSR